MAKQIFHGHDFAYGALELQDGRIACRFSNRVVLLDHTLSNIHHSFEQRCDESNRQLVEHNQCLFFVSNDNFYCWGPDYAKPPALFTRETEFLRFSKPYSSFLKLRNGDIVLGGETMILVRSDNTHIDWPIPSTYGSIELQDGRVAQFGYNQRLYIVDTRETPMQFFALEVYSSRGVFLMQCKNGHLVATYSNGMIAVYDIYRTILIALLTGHSEMVWRVVELPNGCLVSASDDGTLRVWDVDAGISFVLGTGLGPIWHIALMRNGDLISTSEDSSVRIWDVSCWNNFQITQFKRCIDDYLSVLVKDLRPIVFMYLIPCS